MSKWNELAGWLYGDVNTDKGFWYSHPLQELQGLDEEQLFWVPEENSLCMLWHAGHIAHRERTHITQIMQGVASDIPPQYEVFGTDWCSVADVRKAIDSVAGVMKWIEDVRRQSRDYIESLTDEGFHKPSHVEDLSVGHWIFITAAHGALHIGKIQVLRNMLLGQRDNPC